jgi:hypothetical protein
LQPLESDQIEDVLGAESLQDTGGITWALVGRTG